MMENHFLKGIHCKNNSPYFCSGALWAQIVSLRDSVTPARASLTEGCTPGKSWSWGFFWDTAHEAVLMVVCGGGHSNGLPFLGAC